MSTIFYFYTYINLHSGIELIHYTCQIWQKFTTFLQAHYMYPKNPISQFFKNGNQNPQCNVIGNTIKTMHKFCHIWICWEWMIDVANFGSIIRLSDMECCAFIRHQVIEFANNGKTLKLPKIECFAVQKSPHLATSGLAWSCQFLALKHTSWNEVHMTYVFLMVSFDLVTNKSIIKHDSI